MKAIVPLLIAVMLAMSSGCHPRSTSHGMAPATRATTQAGSGSISTAVPTARASSEGVRVAFADAADSVYLDYPATFSPTPSNDFVLLLLPGHATTQSAFGAISLDVPSLPLHLPGMIPMRMVVKGYLDDLRALGEDLRVTEESTVRVSGTAARRLTSERRSKGVIMRETAVITIHDDHVYILRASGTADDHERLVPVFNQILSTLRFKP